MTGKLFNEITDTFVRHHELLFGNGRIYQAETNGLMETRFVDVTEDVAKAISEYLKNERNESTKNQSDI